MRHLSLVWSAISFAMLSFSLPALAPAKDSATAKYTVDFVRDVQPILRNHCYSCHGSEKQEAGLRLDAKKRAFEGGDGGVVLKPKNAAASRLIRVVSGEDEEVGIMPPEGEGRPLNSDQTATLRRWIDQGADWPAEADAKLSASDHWSFQPIRRPTLPMVRNATRARNEIDRFILARLEREGIAPSPEADRATLIRRVYLDLLGLPPAPDEVDQFLKDSSEDAYRRMVDRALDSKHYGERWGRHWLDLARYADSDGYEKDRPRPWAWRYREWVIDALNADMPFDQFTIDQIAGDMLDDSTIEQRVAAGFHRNTLHNTEGGTDKEEDRVKKTIDRTNTVGTTWLGLTVGCAQCHSHKYDPISQRDYYSLYAFFNYISEKDVPAPMAEEEEALQQAKAASIDPELKKPESAVAAHAKKAGAGKTMAQSVVQQPFSTRDTRVFPRGDFLQKKDGVQVTSDVPSVLPPINTDGDQANRLDLARWLVDPANPLTARVTVNRIWQRHFGRGIVATSDDFGSQGDPPSHPELLDWLASEFRDNGWSLKQLHRLILNSATYRQQSAMRDELIDMDPQNILLARQNRLRVEAEIVRDLALAVSGLLHPKIGGPSVRPPQPTEYSKLTYANSAKWKTSSGGDRYRRGMYTFFQRTSPYPMLITFDSPDSTECTAQRSKSNTPLQALTVWNDPVFVECAQHLGRRIVKEAAEGEDAQATRRNRAEYAFQLCFSRQPSDYELHVLLELYDEQVSISQEDEKLTSEIIGEGELPQRVTPIELSAWIAVGRTLLNLDEFITRE